MAKRAVFTVTVDGGDVTANLSPYLLDLTVTLNDGDEGDTASLSLDDSGGQIAMPRVGKPIAIALGWSGVGQRVVFTGTVDETRSAGDRSGGRLLRVSAKGFDAGGKAKEAQRRHWDDATVRQILADAGAAAGITDVRIDPGLAGIRIAYWAMSDESFLHMGRRLARRIGGNFRVQGQQAVMARRSARYGHVVTARHGENLHGWDIAPILSRQIYGKVRARFYDRVAGKWDQVEVETGLSGKAVLTLSPPADSREDAQRQAEAQAEASKRAAGGGSVTVEGDPDAVPDCICALAGARPGIDGPYRVTGVTHSLSKGAGFVTTMELGHPDARQPDNS